MCILRAALEVGRQSDLEWHTNIIAKQDGPILAARCMTAVE